MNGPCTNESCYLGIILQGIILQRNYRQMTILWPFSYNSFVKLHCNNFWETQHDYVISKSVKNEVCYKGYCISIKTLTLCIRETPKPVLLQTV